ncbi:MAG: Gfo/Idh/MocA family oxidoreductase [Phycisphaerae bacterium]|nr:Gfo/Idh/MocA family oxidoreductase [Phycisphaerae bacterium]
MFKIFIISITTSLLAIGITGCGKTDNDKPATETKVNLITLDPGHFHAALVQKTMYDQISPTVYVYGPDGPDTKDHLNRIDGFNNRKDDPTSWDEKVYTGVDFLEKMISEKKGNVVVISGNNAKKTDYIFKTVEAGFNVLADKPMVITPEKFPLLIEAFDQAEKNNVLLYDVMTERHEITTVLQKELAHSPAVFGQLQKGSIDAPAITKESVHHFFKYVAGNAIKRPGWFFDVTQEGDGIVDVSTHLVDLIQWECFPEQIIDYKNNVEMLQAKRWATELSQEQFTKVTQLESFPDYLSKDIKNNTLNVFSNGEFTYKINDVHAKVSVIWNYQAPEGAGDTHYSIMRGTKCNLIIQQGKDENYKPTLYVEAIGNNDIAADLQMAITETLQEKYPGIALEAISGGKWKVVIPAKYHVGHEAHFGQVTEKYLKYLADGKLPKWEVPNMIAKYFTTTAALKMAMEQQ